MNLEPLWSDICADDPGGVHHPKRHCTVCLLYFQPVIMTKPCLEIASLLFAGRQKPQGLYRSSMSCFDRLSAAAVIATGRVRVPHRSEEKCALNVADCAEPVACPEKWCSCARGKWIIHHFCFHAPDTHKSSENQSRNSVATSMARQACAGVLPQHM